MSKPGHLPWDNPFIDAGWCFESMTVTAVMTCTDTGKATDRHQSQPVCVQLGAGTDSIRTAQFQESGGSQWEHLSSLLHTHFTSTAARNAFAAAWAAAQTDAERNAILQTYKDNTVGGNWGTLAVAP